MSTLPPSRNCFPLLHSLRSFCRQEDSDEEDAPPAKKSKVAGGSKPVKKKKEEKSKDSDKARHALRCTDNDEATAVAAAVVSAPLSPSTSPPAPSDDDQDGGHGSREPAASLPTPTVTHTRGVPPSEPSLPEAFAFLANPKDLSPAGAREAARRSRELCPPDQEEDEDDDSDPDDPLARFLKQADTNLSQRSSEKSGTSKDRLTPLPAPLDLRSRFDPADALGSRVPPSNEEDSTAGPSGKEGMNKPQSALTSGMAAVNALVEPIRNKIRNKGVGEGGVHAAEGGGVDAVDAPRNVA